MRFPSSVAIESVTDEALTNGSQQVCKFLRRRCDVDDHVLFFGRPRANNRFAQDGRKEKRVLLLYPRREKCSDEIRIGAGRHESRDNLRSGCLFAVFARVGNFRVGEQVLVVDGNDGQTQLVSDVAGHGFEVGDDKIQVPICCLLL